MLETVHRTHTHHTHRPMCANTYTREMLCSLLSGPLAEGACRAEAAGRGGTALRRWRTEAAVGSAAWGRVSANLRDCGARTKPLPLCQAGILHQMEPCPRGRGRSCGSWESERRVTVAFPAGGLCMGFPEAGRWRRRSLSHGLGLYDCPFMRPREGEKCWDSQAGE